MGGRGTKKTSGRGAPVSREKMQSQAELSTFDMPRRGETNQQHPMTPEEKAQEIQDIFSGNEEFVREQQPWVKNLSSDQLYALKNYQGSSGGINGNLRVLENPSGPGAEFFKGSSPDSYTKENIKNITEALGKSSLHKPVVVYRGITYKNYTEDEIKGMIGKTYYDGGFMSTSLKKSFASDWGNNTAFRITLPKGAKAGYMNANPSGHNSFEHEYELLIQRGARFEITGYKKESSYYGGDKFIVEMKYVGQKPLSQLKYKG